MGDPEAVIFIYKRLSGPLIYFWQDKYNANEN